MSGKLNMRKVAEGTWRATLDFGKSPYTGKRQRHEHVIYARDEVQARSRAERWAEKVEGTYADGVSLALGDQLLRYVSEREKAGEIAESTVRLYRDRCAKRYAAPLAKVPVSEITTRDLDTLFIQLLTVGPKGGDPLDRGTVRIFRAFLSKAFSKFVADHLCESNPVRDTLKASQSSKRGEALDETSLRKVVAWLDKELAEGAYETEAIMRRNAAMAMFIALHTGMRISEVCALRRCDVWLMRSTVSVNGAVIEGSGGAHRQNDTKSHRVRNVSVTPEVRDVLRAHERWQDGYLPTAANETPLLTLDGSIMTPSYVRSQFDRMRRETMIGRSYTFHSLRHTHATWLMQAGVDFRTVQERLGHSSAAITLDKYAHVLPGRDADAAGRFGMALKDVTG